MNGLLVNSWNEKYLVLNVPVDDKFWFEYYNIYNDRLSRLKEIVNSEKFKKQNVCGTIENVLRMANKLCLVC